MNPQNEDNGPQIVSLHRVAKLFYRQPLALQLEAIFAVHQILGPRVIGQAEGIGSLAASKSSRPYESRGFNAHQRPTMLGPQSERGSITDPRYYYTMPGADTVAVLPISGMIMKGASSFEESCYGAISTERISYALNQVAADPTIKKIVLDINSPGGQVTGVREVAAQIAALAATRGKTVYAFTDQTIASAAYWLASQANEIITTGTASVGSIGTYIAWLDESVKMQTQGVSLNFFGSGKHKGLGLPGKALSQDDRNYLQAKVDDINTQFVSAVKAGRPRASADALTSAGMYPGTSTIPGASAVKHGLADGVVASWEDFAAMFAL